MTIDNSYTLLKQLGQGGNSTVYQAKDEDGALVAVKMLKVNFEKESREKRKRFKNEIKFCRQNNHPHILHVLDDGVYAEGPDKYIFCVMPLYEKNLRTLLQSGIDGDTAEKIFLDILDGLQFAHNKEVWHRDIKPENILIDNEGNAIIADFGIAHFCSEQLATDIRTKKGDRLANFQYAAPEQRNRNQLVDGRADIYAIGLILNEMFTGQIIGGINYMTISSVNKDFAYLDELVSGMITQNPEDRLFPVENISIKLLSLKEEKRNNEQMIALAANLNQNQEGFVEMPVPKVIGKTYADGHIRIQITEIPITQRAEWFNILQSGHYNHSYFAGYNPNRLVMPQSNIIAMNLWDEDERSIKNIVKNIMEWFSAATKEYNQRARIVYEKAQRDQKRKIEAEIEKLKREEEIRKILESL